MSVESGVAGALIAKFGLLKLFTLGAALAGAAMMAIFRPPKTKREMLYQAAIALGSSFLFGNVFAEMIDYWFDFINMETASLERVVQFQVAVHGLVGAVSWGIFGGVAVLRDKFFTDPMGTVRDIKNG